MAQSETGTGELSLADVMHLHRGPLIAPVRELTSQDSLQLLLLEEEQRPTIYGVLYTKIRGVRNLLSDKLKPGIESIYCKISVRKQFKRTSVVPLKHRGCVWNQVVRSRKHPFNLVRIQVFAFDSTTSAPHELIGTVAFHLHDIIKVTQVSGEFDLLDEHLFVGVIDLDVSFCYGLYGYGYSAQLKEEPVVRSVEDHLQFCLFPRVAPPPERTEWDRMTLAPTAISQPPFGMLKDVVPLSYAKELLPVLEQLEDGNTENREFVDKYLGRFTELRGQMHNIQDRQKRLMFLHQTVMSGSQKQEAIKSQPKEDRGYSRFMRQRPPL